LRLVNNTRIEYGSANLNSEMETITQRDVSTAQDLIAAVRDASVDRIAISGDLAGLSSLELVPGQALTGAARATLQFKDHSDGIRLSSNTLTVAGGLTTHGSAVAPLAVEGSESLSLKVASPHPVVRAMFN
jgi:hypothetical protein